jgi:hypothetical protein
VGDVAKTEKDQYQYQWSGTNSIDFGSATAQTTQGSEFYFSFMRAINYRTKKMTLMIASKEAGWVKFTDAEGVETWKSFSAGTTSIELAKITDKKKSLENNADGHTTTILEGELIKCYTIKANDPQKQGYKVETFAEDKTTKLNVSCYAGLSGAEIVDVANVYPVEALGNEYYVISRPGNEKLRSDNTGGYWPSEALVMATEDNTEIEIYPTCLLDGQSETAAIDNKISITLNAGETYLIRAYETNKGDVYRGRNDLSGTRIVTKQEGDNRCKKIAVFAGVQHGSGQNSEMNNGDYEYDQLFPTHLWGKTFIVANSSTYNSDVVRIVASQPCTEIKVNGEYKATIHQSEMYEYQDVTGEGAYIEASKPVMATWFLTGEDAKTASGGPAMIVLAPIEQYLNEIIFARTENGDVSTHSILVVSPTDIKESTLLNGNPISGWEPIVANPKYSSVIVDIPTSDTYELTNNANPSKGGFNAYLFASNSENAGYGYSVGSAARAFKSGFVLTSGKEYSNEELNDGVCVGTTVNLRPNIPTGATVGKVEWVVKEKESGILVASGTFKDEPYELDVTFTKSNIVYTTDMRMWLYSSDCFVSVDDVIEVNAEYRVTQETHLSDLERTVCQGDIIEVPVEELQGKKIVYSWYEVEENGTKKLLDGLTTNEISTAQLSHGTVGKLYEMQAYEDLGNGVVCDVYVKEVTINIPVAIETALTIEGYGKELRLCNNGEIKNVKVQPTLTKKPDVEVPGANINATLTSNGIAIENPYIFDPVKDEDIVYNVVVSGDNGICQNETKDVTVRAFPDFSARLVSESPDFITPNKLPASGGNVTFTVETKTPPTASDGDYARADDSQYNFTWIPDNEGEFDSSQETTFIEGKANYKVVVSDKEGLCVHETNEIFIDKGEIQLPTIIVPGDGTGFGDKYKDPVTGELKDMTSDAFPNGYTTRVFDRYGRQVCNEKNGGWSAESINRSDAGVYFYIIEYEMNGEKQQIRGTIEIERR